MTPADVSDAVVAAVRAVVADGRLDVPVSARAPLTCLDAGTYGTPIALRLAAETRKAPRDLAVMIAESITEKGLEAEVTGDGFLTLRLDSPGDLATGIVTQGRSYGHATPPKRPWPERPRDFTNKGFAVRYAYERAVATKRRAQDLGINPGAPGILDHPYERILLKELADLPARAEQATRENDPRPLKRNLERIAEAFHQVYEQCPALPKGDERPGAMHEARRTLAEATRIALENGMHMIGEIPRERI